MADITQADRENYEAIYLEPESLERCWCQDQIEDDWQKYIRADLVDALRIRAETAEAERDEARSIVSSVQVWLTETDGSFDRGDELTSENVSIYLQEKEDTLRKYRVFCVSEREALTLRVKELEEALEPFAAVATSQGGRRWDIKVSVQRLFEGEEYAPLPTPQDFWNAKGILETDIRHAANLLKGG